MTTERKFMFRREGTHLWEVLCPGLRTVAHGFNLDDIQIPEDAVELLFSEHSEEMLGLIDRTKSLPITNKTKTHLISIYATSGIKQAEQTINSYLQSAPNGTMVIYRGNDDAGRHPLDEYSITDGKTGIAINVDTGFIHENERKIVESKLRDLALPLNVYTRHATVTVPLEEFWKLLPMPQSELRTIAERLERLSQIHVSITRRHKYDVVRAILYGDETELRRAESDVARRNQRDRLFQTLGAKPEKIPNGILFTEYQDNVYYLQNDGKLFKLDYSESSIKEAVFTAVTKQKIPTKLVRVNPKDVQIPELAKNAIEEAKKREFGPL